MDNGERIMYYGACVGTAGLTPSRTFVCIKYFSIGVASYIEILTRRFAENEREEVQPQ